MTGAELGRGKWSIAVDLQVSTKVEPIPFRAELLQEGGRKTTLVASATFDVRRRLSSQAYSQGKAS